MQEERPPLNYQTPVRRGEDLGRPAKLFFLGLLIGSAVSTIWVVGWNHNWMGWALVLIPLAKLIAAAALTGRRPWRPMGAGLLVSIGVGALIFFFTCAANFKI